MFPDKEEKRINIFPFLLRCDFACFKNLSIISFPLFPAVVINLESLGSSMSSGKYGGLNTIKSNFSLILENKLDLIVLIPFLMQYSTAVSFMSAAKTLQSFFIAISAKYPEPVPSPLKRGKL